MFSNSRPVSSKAALKVLYQLAYISSGTAVGAAALCAEERRRRTLLVQKIADNAKRIRQSPRHVHHKAKEAEERYVPLVKDGKGVRSTGLDPGDRAVRGPELPSVVDTGYDQLVQPSHRPRRRRTKVHRQNADIGVDEAKSPLRSSKAHVQRSQLRREANRFVRPEKIPGLVPQGTAMLDDDTLFRKYVTSRKRVNESGAHETEKQPVRCGKRPTFITLQFVQTQRGSRIHAKDDVPLNFRNIKHDIDLFFDCAPWPGDLREQNRVAAVLLRLASRKALLVESRSLVLWLASREALTQAAILTICEESCGMGISNPNQVRQFYLDLFAMPVVTQHNIVFRTRARVAVFLGILRSNALERPELVLEQVLATKETEDYLPHELKSQYDKLCSEGNPTLAAKLLSTVLKRPSLLGQQALACVGMIDHSITWAHSRGDFATAAQLFKRKLLLCIRARCGRQDPFTNTSQQLDRICQIADQRQTYEQLASICHVLGRHHLVQLDFVLAEIGSQSKATLAIASTTVRSFGTYIEELIRTLRHSLPVHLQSRLIDAQMVHQLKGTWQTTRSLPACFARYEKGQRVQEQSVTKRALGPAEIALVEICNLAEKPHRALQILASGQNNGLHTRDSFSLAALTLAGMKAWVTLEALIKLVMKSDISLVGDLSATRRLNAVVHLYARQHDASESWNFITGLVERIGFRPNRVATKAMLRSLVMHMRPGQATLIPRWLAYLRTLGIKIELDSTMAVAMFRDYYRINRIPHVLFMEMCRRLVSVVPSLQSTGWASLIKQAIGYDLRELDTRYKNAMRLAAEHNWRKALESHPIVPVPTKVSAFRGQTSGANLQLPPEIQEHGRENVDGIMSNGSPHKQHVQATSSDSASADDIDLGDKLVNHASRQIIDPHDELIEDFYSDERADHHGVVDHARPKTVTDSTGNELDYIGPIGFANFSDLAPDQREDEELDVEALTETDFMLQNDNLKEQEKLGYAGFDSSYRTRKLASDMIYALSRKRHDEVLDIYESSLDETGLPSSPLALTVAVQALISRDGGSLVGAKSLLDAASSAGFNVSCAMGPVLIREMRLLQPEDKRSANKLRVKVIDYYRANDENGWPVSHHVGVSAANLLIDNHRPEYGINLLESIYKSEWSKRQSPDIVAMTVLLKGYIALKSLEGIMWSVRKVLRDDIRLNRRFLHHLRTSPRAFDSASHLTSGKRLSVEPWVLRQLKKARAVCAERRLRQRLEAKHLGNKLIRAISLSVRAQQQTTEERSRSLLAKGHFGRSLRRPSEASPTSSGVAGHHCTDIARRHRLRSALLVSVRNAKAQRCRRTMSIGATYLQLRKAQYRAFLKAGLTTPDGYPISFRYYLATRTGKGKLAKSAESTASTESRTQPQDLQTTHEGSIAVKEEQAANEDFDHQMNDAQEEDHASYNLILSGRTGSKVNERRAKREPSTSLRHSNSRRHDPPWLESLKDVQAQRPTSLGKGVTLPPAYYRPLIINEQDGAYNIEESSLETTHRSRQVPIERREPATNDETELIKRYIPTEPPQQRRKKHDERRTTTTYRTVSLDAE